MKISEIWQPAEAVTRLQIDAAIRDPGFKYNGVVVNLEVGDQTFRLQSRAQGKLSKDSAEALKRSIKAHVKAEVASSWPGAEPTLEGARLRRAQARAQSGRLQALIKSLTESDNV